MSSRTPEKLFHSAQTRWARTVLIRQFAGQTLADPATLARRVAPWHLPMVALLWLVLGTALLCAPELRAEERVSHFDLIELSASGDGDWSTKTFASAFSAAPIVITGPGDSAQAAVVRLRNITPTSFDITHDEWSNTDGVEAGYKVPVWALSAGSHDLYAFTPRTGVCRGV